MVAEETEEMTESQYELLCPSCGANIYCTDCAAIDEMQVFLDQIKHLEVKLDQAREEIFNLRESLLGFTPQLLDTLIKIVDKKDQYTHQHSLRVTELSLVIGSALMLEPHELNILKRAAKFHDIGKLGVSESILKKPGPLTDAEYDEVKKHPAMGVEIISDVKALRDILNIIHAHHERWDGKGYPRGLKEIEIPLLARIIAVADTIDAMSLDRVYKAGRTRHEILEELKKEAGHQFDPDIVWAVIQAQIDLR